MACVEKKTSALKDRKTPPYYHLGTGMRAPRRAGFCCGARFSSIIADEF
jgi:hypothetical protein